LTAEAQQRDSVKILRAKVYVIENRCKGCGFCIEFCPVGVLEFSKGINDMGAHFPNVKDESECNACRICEGICPDFAIFVIKKLAGAFNGR